MNQEPSLLEFLKALLDPRREAIRLSDLEARAAADASEGEPASVEALRDEGAAADPVMRGRVPRASGEIDTVEHPSAVAPRPTRSPDSEPASLPPSDRGPLPWRTLGSLVLAIAAQSALAPPDRSVEMGVFLYIAAFLLGALGFWSGEIPVARLPRRRYRPDDGQYSRTMLWAALPVILFAFVVLGGNRFTLFNTFFWLLGLGLLAFGLRRKPEESEDRLQRFMDALRPPYRFSISPWTLLLAGGIAVILFFRFYHLEQVPSQMFSDHAEKLLDVQDVLNGETHIFFPRNTGREFVQMYLTAFSADTLGYGLTFMALKMGTALAGLVAFPFIYLLGVEIANRRVGFLAMVMAGMSYWLNVITRVALRFSLYPLFVAPVLYYIVRGLRSGNRNDFIWAGIFLGLGLHGYSPFRFVPLLVVLAVVLFILHAGSDARRRQALLHLGIVVAVSLVVFMPLLRFMVENEANRSIVLYRSLTRIAEVETEYPGNPLTIFFGNMGRSLAMLAWDNGNTWVHSIPLRPALDIVSGALFYLGYGLLIVRYIRRRSWEDLFLVLSVPFLMLPSAMSLAFPQENPSLNRSSGALVPVFLIAALALEAFLVAVRGWLGSRSGRLAAWGVVMLLLAWSSMANYDLVFRQYADQFNRSAWNTTELGSVIRGFADSVGTEETAWVIPWPHWVDTRLVGINAGVYIKDYAISRELLPDTLPVAGPKMFIFHFDDVETQNFLEELYPDGVLRRYPSEVPGKDFMVFTTLGP